MNAKKELKVLVRLSKKLENVEESVDNVLVNDFGVKMYDKINEMRNDVEDRISEVINEIRNDVEDEINNITNNK